MESRPAEVGPQASELVSSIRVVEERLLRLIRETAKGAIPIDEVIGELPLLAKDVGRMFRQAEETQARRDMQYAIVTQLRELKDHCVWLYRKIHLELAFFEKLYLESQLRSQISEDAYRLYQRLMSAEELDRRFHYASDEQVERRLRGEASELSGVMGLPHSGLPAAGDEPSPLRGEG